MEQGMPGRRRPMRQCRAKVMLGKKERRIQSAPEATCLECRHASRHAEARHARTPPMRLYADSAAGMARIVSFLLISSSRRARSVTDDLTLIESEHFYFHHMPWA